MVVTMTSVREPAPWRAQWRARVAAWARAERGDTLIEVMMAALLVALIAAAVLTAYAAIDHQAGNQRQHVEAGALAQQDEARLRGLTITALSALSTPQQSTKTIDGTVYTITSSTSFISGTDSGAACATGAQTSNADEVATTSVVSWGTTGDVQHQVEVHGLVTPNEGGSLIVTAVDQTGAGLAGLTSSPSGPTTVAALATDSNGCAVFGGLDGGDYTVSFSDPGYVDVNGNAPASQTVPVVPTTTAKTQELQLGRAATLNVGFSTTYNGSTVAATADQFMAINNNITSPAGYRGFGSDSTSSNSNFSSSLTTGATMFPFTTAYKLYAGGCVDPLVPTAGTVTQLVGVGGTYSATLPEPAMIVDVWTGMNSASKGTLVTTKPDVTITDTDAGCGSNEDYPPEQIPTSSTVGALVNPGVPYGTYTVCADANISNAWMKNTTTIANTSYTAGNVGNIYLGSGSGASSGTCP